MSIPAVTPAATPPETVACPLVADHVPPVITSVRVVVLPPQTAPPPVIVPASGSELIVIMCIAESTPHEFVTL